MLLSNRLESGPLIGGEGEAEEKKRSSSHVALHLCVLLSKQELLSQVEGSLRFALLNRISALLRSALLNSPHKAERAVGMPAPPLASSDA